MTIVVTFEDFVPPPRYDAVPFVEARVEESATQDGVYTAIETVTFLIPDPDPANPGIRNFTTDQGTATGYWYQIVFVDGSGGESLPTAPLQNVAGAVSPHMYAEVAELARILKIRTPTAEQTVALRRVLEAAASEIDAELGRTDSLSSPYPALVVEVSLERAVEHWAQGEVPFGIVGLGDTGAVYTARDTWDRHAHKLSPLKQTWGLA